MPSYSQLFQDDLNSMADLGMSNRTLLKKTFQAGFCDESAGKKPYGQDIPVHFVFQGGGILGIAHLGFFSGLERAGFRPVGLAGTSAGAILALLIAAARGTNHDADNIGSRLLDILWQMPAESFMDGPYSSRRLTKFALSKKSIASPEMSMPIIATIRRVLVRFGIHRGITFESWLATELSSQFGIQTCNDLTRSLKQCFAETVLAETAPDDLLKLIATGLPIHADEGLSNGIKFVFPGDAHALQINPDQDSPALYARASMSVPIFFEPYKIDVDATGWRKLVSETFRQTLHPEAIRVMNSATGVAFIDGGLLSNFPIDSFFEKTSSKFEKTQTDNPSTSISSITTIGSTLVTTKKIRRRNRNRGAAALLHYVQTVIDGMRHIRDRDAMRIGNRFNDVAGIPDAYIAPVDVGDHNWLNFQLSDAEKADLYRRGIQAARAFIETTIRNRLTGEAE